MARTSRKPAPDQAQRDAAVCERTRNVLIDAGAGTGKTTTLVDRLVEMLAPTDHVPATPIDRLAAITFTRKAAGELRLRIRQRLLEGLAETGLSAERGVRLKDALAGLDTAYVGTIHSFADRLLHLRPVEAQLSPSYEIVEDNSGLVRETFDILLDAVQSGTLNAELAGTEAATRAEEATSTVLDALDVGIPADSQETGWQPLHGLDALVAGFIGERDIAPLERAPATFDRTAFQAAANEYLHLATPLQETSQGAAWIIRMAGCLQSLGNFDDPARLLQMLRRQLERRPRDVTKRDTFKNDDVAWKVWKRLTEADRSHSTPLLDALCAPLHRWMATRLARLFPVVVALYEKVKARNRVLDQLDLLIKLRDLLVHNRSIRAEFQRMFDHIFVDEFQDTDPLQAEIVLFLCEREPAADRWEDVVLRDGALTLVGDPKQSIYRFRRADIAMYDRTRQIVKNGGCLEVTLSANFRSVPPLINWLNDRFDHVLGTSPDGRPFDPDTGRTFQQPLVPAREGGLESAVQILPFDFADAIRHTADEYRALEGRVLARYLRWLIEASERQITDPLDGRPRRVQYGDIAVLAVSTWNLSLLFKWLDDEGIPYASRGGMLFLEDSLNRQFLLGLRALADRDDGVAEAALLRPPFFAVDLSDLLQERAARGEDSHDERVCRAREARALVRELRRLRFQRPVGATARDLLDRTAFARAVALGPNGAQRLARVRELCVLLEQTAASEGLDYDVATAQLRKWVDATVQLDPPSPVGSEAVQVLTVHQAKGLEFPVVILWDGKLQWSTNLRNSAWRMERTGRGWTMNLKTLSWEEPQGLGLKGTEDAYLQAERRRVIYVAATRARDLLVVPRAGSVPPGKYVCGDLLDNPNSTFIHEMEMYKDGSTAAWAGAIGEPASRSWGEATNIEQQVASRWIVACEEVVRPRYRPVSVSDQARTVVLDEASQQIEPATRKPRKGRFGSLFGSTVHQALGQLLCDSNLTVEEAIRRAAQRNGLTEHLDEAVGDASRTLDALRSEDILRPIGPDLQIEYPVAGVWGDGQLLNGYIDLVSATADRLDVIDLKTDAPPQGSVDVAYPEYVSQVRMYGRLLENAGVAAGRRLRCGLLFTADGIFRWCEPLCRPNPGNC